MTTTASSAKRKKGASDGPNPVDIHVGARLRLRRSLTGMSQEQLGKALGLTFQQIQKYERGANRMGASRLYQLGRILNVQVDWFFDELPSLKKPAAGFAESGQASLKGGPEGKADSADDPEIMQRRETLEFVRAYYRITDPKKRRKVYELIKSMADESGS